MCQAERNFLCHFCKFDTQCQEERTIIRMAFKYWNEDIEPPVEYQRKVWDYIQAHPEMFKGYIPM